MNTQICPIISLVNQRLADIRTILMERGSLTPDQREAYLALLKAKEQLWIARSRFQNQDVKRAG